jgi:hypothetical protein
MEFILIYILFVASGIGLVSYLLSQMPTQEQSQESE